jgi:ComF family protein
LDNPLSVILNDFLNLFIPSKCINCGINLFKQEKFVCAGCCSKIPKTNFIRDTNNPISQIFWGRVKLESAFSFYFFSKGGILRNLVHEIKYRGGKELAYEMGVLFGLDLKKEKFLLLYDCICPVPLHKTKQRTRGYNQSEWLARGIAKILEIPVDNNILSRKIFTKTQTKKNRQERWENVKDAFEVVDRDKIKNKHILLIDDILTTGATIEACAAKLLDVEGTKVSVATLGVAFDN